VWCWSTNTATQKADSLTQVDDELDNLEDGDPLLPPDADTTGTLEVVPVHDHVHGQVKGDGNPGDGSQANQLGIAKKGGGAMVIGVEEGEGLLLQEEEDGIEQFEEFGEIVQLGTDELAKAISGVDCGQQRN
jgi:hypothetical protein